MRLTAALTVFLAGGTLYAQNVISAKSGIVHLAEGDVLINGKTPDTKAGIFTSLKPGELLTTAEGRAEMLLAPGVVLRAGEHTTVKMVSNDLADTKVELVEGSINLEASDNAKENKTSVVMKDTTISLAKNGIYSFDTKPMSARVWDGEAVVEQGGKTTELKEGKQITLDGAAKVAKFNKDDTDALYRWAKRRSSYLAAANMSGAGSTRMSSFLGTGAGMGNWYYNNYLGMYTYMPMRGVLNSPFGYRFFSPNAWMNTFYYNPVFTGYGAGWNNMPHGAYGGSLGYGTSRSMGGVAVGGGGGAAAGAPRAGAPPVSQGGGHMHGGGMHGGGGGMHGGGGGMSVPRGGAPGTVGTGVGRRGH